MYSKKRILAMTATRSDYDLLSYLYKLLSTDSEIDFRVIVSGTHLANTYGHSFKEIEKDGIKILSKIETLLDSDSRGSRVKSASILMQNCIHTILDFDPEMVIYCGDREDALVGAMVSAYLQIPGVHFFGGDHASDGNIDNPVRHSASKLSTVHVVSTVEHKQRLMKIGEPEYRIFQVGTPAIDKLVKEEHLSKEQLLKNLNLDNKWPQKTAILTYHPMTQEENEAGQHMKMIIEELLQQNYFIFANSPNADSGSKKIIEAMAEFKNNNNFFQFKNLPRKEFVNLMRHCDLMIGNSSAGVVEAATCKTKVINTGKRQFGRFNSGNVVFCDLNRQSLKEAFAKVESKEYSELVNNLLNPYGDGNSSEKIYKIIKESNFQNLISKREDPLCL